VSVNCTPRALHTICSRLEVGEGLPLILRDATLLPSWAELNTWMDRDPEVRARIRASSEAGEQFLLAECVLIADTPVQAHEDEHEGVIGPPLEGDLDGPPSSDLRLVKRKVKDALGHRTLRINTRLRVLEKLNPKRWGAKVEVEAGADLASAIAAARARAADPPTE
jgi:hypothetical protein